MTQIVRCDLVNIVIQPVGEQEMPMTTPGGFWGECRIIIREVVKRNNGVKAGLVIATILTR
ncbi:hypothetical protein D3C87_2182770 [compost metagenome]